MDDITTMMPQTNRAELANRMENTNSEVGANVEDPKQKPSNARNPGSYSVPKSPFSVLGGYT